MPSFLLLRISMKTLVMHGSTIDVNQMQPQGKKRRMDWESLDLNDSGSGSNGIGVVEAKMPNLVTNGKDCERSRSKSVNGGKISSLANTK